MEIWRLLACVGASIFGTLLGHPFDHMRVRMHTMRSLPDGRMPYKGLLDLFCKIYRYEGQVKFNSNLMTIYAGSYASFVRLLGVSYVSMRLLDFYH